ncbi:hypothetical protein OG589_32990 [Sphaerisporangium sp. NBC_01403]
MQPSEWIPLAVGVLNLATALVTWTAHHRRSRTTTPTSHDHTSEPNREA